MVIFKVQTSIIIIINNFDAEIYICALISPVKVSVLFILYYYVLSQTIFAL